MRLIPSFTLMRMKRSPMLLATQYKPKVDTKGDDLDDEEWDPTYGLKRADEIVLADDTSFYQAFRGVLWTAPQEDLIEGKEIFRSSVITSAYREIQFFIKTSALANLACTWWRNTRPLQRYSPRRRRLKFENWFSSACRCSFTNIHIPPRLGYQCHGCLWVKTSSSRLLGKYPL